MIGIGAFLKFLSFFSVLSPSCGAWVKRLFFILTVYIELQRVKVTDSLALAKINDKVLKITEPLVLNKALLIAQTGLTHLDFDVLTCSGLTIRQVLSQQQITQPEAELVGGLLVSQTPSGLNYGEQMMTNDVVRLLRQIKA